MGVHCVAFPENDTNNFFLGSEDANIYHGKIHTKD